MKTTFFNSIGRSKVWSIALALSTIFVLSLGLVFAQDKNQKRITALQLGEGSEGSRVTIVSDSALNDYEAFRRGDRFYVRIPAGEFAAAQSSFQGDGFDDVQVQRVGDSVVISFKLQPGASARVDQRSNKLDVIFTSPARLARNESAVRNRVASTPAGSTRTATLRNSQKALNSDVAGPVPPGSPEPTASQTFSTPSYTDGPTATQPSYGRRPNADGRVAANAAQNQTTTVVPASTPYAGPPATSAYPASPANTPFVAVQTKPATGTTGLTARGQAVTAWISANRKASIIGATALLALVLLAAGILYRRRGANVVKTKRVNVPRVQPKYDPDLELDELLSDRVQTSKANASFDELGFDTAENDVVNTGAFHFRSSALEVFDDDDPGPELDFNIPAKEVSRDDEWATPMSSLHPSTFSNYQREEQEREVFEL